MFDWERKKEQLSPDSTPAALEHQVKPHLALLRSVPQKLADLLLAYRKQRLAIAGDKMISSLAMTTQTKQAVGAALEAIDGLQNDAQEAKAAIEGEIAAVFAASSKDVQVALLRETQELRAWERWRRLLDSGTDAAGVVERAAAAADLVGLQVLRAELPIYMESKRVPEDSARVVMSALDAVERPLLPEVQRRARDLQDELAAGWYRLNMNFNFARSEIDGNPGTATVLAVWGTSDAVIQVSEKLPPLQPV